MAEVLKVLAQSAPSATTLTDAYTVPGATSATVSSIMVCNRSASEATFRVSVAVAGAADGPGQYVVYDLPIAGTDVFAATVGLTLGAADVVRVWASSGDLSFSLFGVEVT